MVVSSWLAHGDLVSFSGPLVLSPLPAGGGTFASTTSSFCISHNSGFVVTASFSSPWLVFAVRFETGSCVTEATAGECLPSPAPLPPSPSDSEPVAELLSEGECDGDFFPCFSSFFLFFFFFLAFLCFLDFASPVSETLKEHLKGAQKD